MNTFFITPSGRGFSKAVPGCRPWYTDGFEVNMGRLGIPELLIILTIIILIFGANRLPEIGRGIGKGIKNFKSATKESGEAEEKS
jgi:sec-independent protein translocase protein TatA